MKSTLDPKKIQHKVYMSYFQDGLWDVVLGLFLLSWGFTVFLGLGWLPGVSFVVFYTVALALKRKVTYPRIGYSRPAEQRRQISRFLIAGAAIFLLGIMVFLIIIANGMPQFFRDYFELLFTTMLAIIIGLIGYWWGIIRWYGYAGLVFICAICNQWLGLSFELSFIIPGGLVLLYGIFIFIGFIRNYTALSKEGVDGSQ